jgi:adenylate cyclase
MATRFKRKLTAILSTDAVGYSRLMGEDDATTVRTLETYKSVISDLIDQHRGRVVDAPGDNILAEFASGVDAVQCAVAAQNEIQARNLELPETRRMQFRMGINLGDVIEEEDRIYGDGVNIAARLESLAEPGGICVSKTAFDHIEAKLPLGYEYLGEQNVKNIAKPVPAYQVLMESRVTVKTPAQAEPKEGTRRRSKFVALVSVLLIAAGVAVFWRFVFPPVSPPAEKASQQQMAFPLPDKPSIAVLAFENMSGDPKQEYFSDGLTEGIITGLSKIPQLFVIARNSSFAFKGKAVSVKEVGRKLGVRYVLEGSVRKQEDRIRITAQLIDAQTGGHVWSESYDRDLKDVFAMQDEITLAIMRAIRVKLTEGEQAALWQRKGLTNNLRAFEKYLQGRMYSQQATKEANDKSRQLYEEAIILDLEFASAYSELAFSHVVDAIWGWSKDPRESSRKAYENATAAITLDDSLDTPHSVLGLIYCQMREFDKAVAEGERGVELNPNGADALAFLGYFLNVTGRPGEANSLLKKAIRLNPMPPAIWYAWLGISYRLMDQYDKAIAEFEKGLQVQPDHPVCLIQRTAAYSQAGRQEDARKSAAEFIRLNPKFRVEHFVRIYKVPAVAERLADALRKAGLE